MPKSIEAYQVKCKCGTVRVDGLNEFVQAAISCSYTREWRAVTDHHGVTRTYSINGWFGCGVCDRSYTVKQIRATVKPNHKCDARCTGATGHNCECSCGGKNHGVQS